MDCNQVVRWEIMAGSSRTLLTLALVHCPKSKRKKVIHKYIPVNVHVCMYIYIYISPQGPSFKTGERCFKGRFEDASS